MGAAFLNGTASCYLGVNRNLEQLLQHPHALHRGMVVESGDYRAIASPIKLSRTPASLRLVPPAFGEHTEAVRARLTVP